MDAVQRANGFSGSRINSRFWHPKHFATRLRRRAWWVTQSRTPGSTVLSSGWDVLVRGKLCKGTTIVFQASWRGPFRRKPWEPCNCTHIDHPGCILRRYRKLHGEGMRSVIYRQALTAEVLDFQLRSSVECAVTKNDSR